MLNFNADDLAGSVEVKHDIRCDFVRIGSRTILKLNVKGVGIGIIFESHG